MLAICPLSLFVCLTVWRGGGGDGGDGGNGRTTLIEPKNGRERHHTYGSINMYVLLMSDDVNNVLKVLF